MTASTVPSASIECVRDVRTGNVLWPSGMDNWDYPPLYTGIARSQHEVVGRYRPPPRGPVPQATPAAKPRPRPPPPPLPLARSPPPQVETPAPTRAEPSSSATAADPTREQAEALLASGQALLAQARVHILEKRKEHVD